MQSVIGSMLYPAPGDPVLKLLSDAGTSGDAALYAEAARRLIAFGVQHGLDGNLWQAYLAAHLVTDENPITRACAFQTLQGSLKTLALACACVWRKLYHFDFSAAGKEAAPIFAQLLDMRYPAAETAVGKRLLPLRDQLAAAQDDEAFLTALCEYLSANGSGQSALWRAFSVASLEPLRLSPIDAPASVSLDDLIGYEKQKQAMVDNMEAFLSGQPFNHMLLYGDAGTGKSTSVKALLCMYESRGLRLLEMRKHQLSALGDAIRMLSGRANKYMIYMDDLSFEENETGYKNLKAVMEGGVAQESGNVLLLATSNRRHLVREDWKDRSDMEHEGDVHRSDTLEEKLSLAARFGCAVQFGIPTVRDFDDMVFTLYRRQGGRKLSEEVLRRRAYAFEIRHGGVSGRTAQQFVNVVLAEEARENGAQE